MKKISFGCDHGGFALKEVLFTYLAQNGFEIIDHGCYSTESVDYPDFAAQVCQDIQQNKADQGLLVCGTGIGMAITANKFHGIRAASLTDVYSTVMTRQHNDLNVLCLGARVIGPGLALKILETFLTTPFEKGRHQTRLDKIKKWEVL